MGVREIFSYIRGTKSSSKQGNRISQQKKFQRLQQQLAQQKQTANSSNSTSSSSVSNSHSGGGSVGGSSSTSSSSKNSSGAGSYSNRKNLAVQYQYYKQSTTNLVESTKSAVPACDTHSAEGHVKTKNRVALHTSRKVLELEAKRRSSMASVVLKSLSILLGIFFIFVGLTKLTPRISKELYKELRKEFARYAKVFPLAQTLEFKIPSKWYRRGIGALEILCGLCLTLVPSQRTKQVANLVLIFMMLFATYNHWAVGDKFERIAPSLVFFFMLTCRLIVEYQIKRKEKQDRQQAELADKKDLDQLAIAGDKITGAAAAGVSQSNQQSQQQSAGAGGSVNSSSRQGKDSRLRSGSGARGKKDD